MGMLDGKVAVVAGASRGIGKGIALELGAAGATVYAIGRTLDVAPGRAGSLRETAAEIEQLGGVGRAVQCDLGDDAAVAALFDQVRVEAGRLDTLVNTVFDSPEFSSSVGIRFWELPISIWRDVVDIGTRTAYVASVYAAPMLMAAPQGLIVNVSSLGAVKYFYNVAYGAGKAALDKMTADMALDFRDEGVAVVSIWPNVTRTENVNEAIARGETERFERFGGAAGLETPRYSGRSVVALATDPDVMAKSGQYFWVAELGEAYNFVDENGLPHRYPKRKT